MRGSVRCASVGAKKSVQFLSPVLVFNFGCADYFSNRFHQSFALGIRFSLSAETGVSSDTTIAETALPKHVPAELSTEFYSSCLPYTLSDPDVLLETELDQRIHPVSIHDFPPLSLHSGEHLA